jgi:hypothetical protein
VLSREKSLGNVSFFADICATFFKTHKKLIT